MKKKIYLNDWTINSGIIGFLNILKEAGKDIDSMMKENYIEFDTEILETFSQDYFSYFFKKYDVAKRTRKKVIDTYYTTIESDINNMILEANTKEDKEKNKKSQDTIKRLTKYIKDTIKTQKDKVKKFNEDSYQIIDEEYSKIKEPKTQEELQEFSKSLNKMIQEIEKEENNSRITLNYFKNILSTNYFGQPSFMNVVKSSCTVQEQQELMQKDYVSNIIENAFLQEVLEGKYEIKEIEEHIQKTTNITKEVETIYHNIQKQIEKHKPLEEMQEYIKKKMNYCLICEEKESITENYTESNFIPLAVSSENMVNFFWNQKPQVPVCSLCKLMMFCIPAGVTLISKIEKDGNMNYKETELYSFINYDTNVKKLLKTNRSLSDNSKKEKGKINPYVDSILDIIDSKEETARWQLDNVFVIEFETEYLGYSRMQYFHILPNVAKFLTTKYVNVLQAISDYHFRLQLTDMMLKNEDTMLVINNRLRENFNDAKVKQAFNCYLATKVRFDLNMLKKEGNKVEEEIQKGNKKIYALYNIGQDIRKTLKNKKEENKLDSYVYRMVNSIKANNKKEFMDVVIRLHLYMAKDVSPIFLEVMQDGNLDFATIGHSFLSGLISDEYRKEEKVEE